MGRSAETRENLNDPEKFFPHEKILFIKNQNIIKITC